MRLIRALCVAFVLAAPASTVAQAAEASHAITLQPDVHFWRHPGQHPLDTDGRSAKAIDCAVNGLNMSAYDARRFREATAQPFDLDMAVVQHRIITLKDGTEFARMTYQGCKTIDNIVVQFDPRFKYERRAEVVRITEADGTVKVYIRPFICNNWSLLEVVPPKKPKCFIVHFDYRSNAHVMAEGNLETAGDLVASGRWKGSADQAYLNDDTLFAFIVFHVDFANKAEFDDFQKDDCSGVADETGFHHEIDWNCDFCENSAHWPGDGTIAAVARAYGIQLPSSKPSGGFRIPCASGVCDFSMPIRYARRFAARRPAVACVDVHRYHVNLIGHDRRDFRDADNFDVIEPAEFAAALAHSSKHTSSIRLARTLTGLGSYQEPGTAE